MHLAFDTAAALILALTLAVLGAALFGAGVVIGGGSRPRAADKEVRSTAAMATALAVLAVVTVAAGWVRAGYGYIGGFAAIALWFEAGLRSTNLWADSRIKFFAKQQSGTATTAKAVQPAKAVVEKTTKVRCHKCQHTQEVPRSASTFQCEECNAKLKRRVETS